MSHGHRMCFPHNVRFTTISGWLFFCAFLPMSSVAQSVTGSSAITSDSVSIPTTNAIPMQTSQSRTGSFRSVTTSFTSSSSRNTTKSSSTSTTSQDFTPQLFPGATPPNGQQVRNAGVFNYYFLFLALFGVITAVFLWWVHRRRKKKKEQMRLSGQNALARDLDGWINTRRWFHGTWRHNQTAAFVRREEGLNERGEAPPPYQPKDEVTVAHEAAASQDPASGLAIPLRTLSRDDIEQVRPPEYRETASRGEQSVIRPDTANTSSTRPETADVQRGT